MISTPEYLEKVEHENHTQGESTLLSEGSNQNKGEIKKSEVSNHRLKLLTVQLLLLHRVPSWNHLD
jgi:hypothetical protein